MAAASPANVCVAIDAMGGDAAPEMVIRGLKLVRERMPWVTFKVYGQASAIQPFLKKFKKLKDAVEVIDTPDVIRSNHTVVQALRIGKNSSMRQALLAVRDKSAHACVSAGNTGAFMAMAKLSLGTLAGIQRPAFASFFPTEKGETVMLDLGANTECSAENLTQFALLGEVFARTVLGLSRPKVGLLNIGSEDHKGHPEIRQAAEMLKQVKWPIHFYGFVEGNDIPLGTVDVVVADGFSGNIALKTAEGTAKLCYSFFKSAFKSSFLAKIGYLFARPALKRLKSRVDPRRYNGAVFLGLDGVVVKSHGGTDAFGFASAVGLAVDMVKHQFVSMVQDEVATLTGQLPKLAAAEFVPVSAETLDGGISSLNEEPVAIDESVT